eukprot:10443966-Lingulodinium_polyedra.AAC.1
MGQIRTDQIEQRAEQHEAMKQLDTKFTVFGKWRRNNSGNQRRQEADAKQRAGGLEKANEE